RDPQDDPRPLPADQEPAGELRHQSAGVLLGPARMVPGGRRFFRPPTRMARCDTRWPTLRVDHLRSARRRAVGAFPAAVRAARTAGGQRVALLPTIYPKTLYRHAGFRYHPPPR